MKKSSNDKGHKDQWGEGEEWHGNDKQIDPWQVAQNLTSGVPSNIQMFTPAVRVTNFNAWH